MTERELLDEAVSLLRQARYRGADPHHARSWGQRRRRLDDRAQDLAADDIVHACPPDGSGGLMPCCGRTPFEVLSERMTLTETVTCPGPEDQDWERRAGEACNRRCDSRQSTDPDNPDFPDPACPRHGSRP